MPNTTNTTAVQELKRRFKTAAPDLYALCSATRRHTRQWLHDYLDRDHKRLFRQIYLDRFWGPEEESASGPGSSLARTAAVRNAIPELISEYRISSLLDIPCGDFWWAQRMDLGSCLYIGADIVDELIAQNNQKYGGPLRRFCALDLTRDRLPQVDLILCRDCLVHMSFKGIGKSLANMKASGSRYLLTSTDPSLHHNINIVTGAHRLLNFELAPFHFPKPIRTIHEQSGIPGQENKSLQLWPIDELPV